MSHGKAPALTKIKALEELAILADHARVEGKVVGLAHGTFDLLHMGHVRHLEAARRECDLLVVTVTADEHVNKGPGRPVFQEELRAEMVAALACVDFVAINHDVSSVPVLNTVKPDVYIKGSDYVVPEDDITGKIVEEKEAVEAHGGRLFFTNDITFSSSRLINRYLGVLDEESRGFLDTQRANGIKERLDDLFGQASKLKVLLVGETIIDQYDYVHPMGKSPKENMIATRFMDREIFAGGVIAAANHVSAFCDTVDVLTMVGDDEYAKVADESLRPNVTLRAVKRSGVPTTRKERFIDHSYMRKLFEVYHFDDEPLSGEIEQQFVGEIEKIAGDYDLVIVTDFGHGLITRAGVTALQDHARVLSVNCQSNSANLGYNLITKYDRANFICIDNPEARLAAHDKFGDIERVISDELPNAIDCDSIIITHGKNGCLTWSKSEGTTSIPAFTKSVVDTVGAGDAFFAVTAPLVACGGTMSDIGFVGNVVGALKVGIVGHRQYIEKVSVQKFIHTLLK